MPNRKNVTLSVSYDFCAAHKLYRNDWSQEKNSSIFGQCARLHGHQYKFEVLIKGAVSKDTGMLINGYEVDRIVKETVLSKIDHTYINDDVPYFKETLTTAENIAIWIFQTLQNAFPEGTGLHKVRLYETPTLYVEYS